MRRIGSSLLKLKLVIVNDSLPRRRERSEPHRPGWFYFEGARGALMDIETLKEQKIKLDFVIDLMGQFINNLNRQIIKTLRVW